MVISAAFEEEYVSQPGRPFMPAVDAMLTINWNVLPLCNSSCTIVNGAYRLTPMVRSKSAKSTCCIDHGPGPVRQVDEVRRDLLAVRVVRRQLVQEGLVRIRLAGEQDEVRHIVVGVEEAFHGGRTDALGGTGHHDRLTHRRLLPLTGSRQGVHPWAW